jgi:hypothetical protein
MNVSLFMIVLDCLTKGNQAAARLVPRRPCLAFGFRSLTRHRISRSGTAAAPRNVLNDLLSEKFVLGEGALMVPQRPGLGVRIDEHVLAKFSTPH